MDFAQNLAFANAIHAPCQEPFSREMDFGLETLVGSSAVPAVRSSTSPLPVVVSEPSQELSLSGGSALSACDAVTLDLSVALGLPDHCALLGGSAVLVPTSGALSWSPLPPCPVDFDSDFKAPSSPVLQSLQADSSTWTEQPCLSDCLASPSVSPNVPVLPVGLSFSTPSVLVPGPEVLLTKDAHSSSVTVGSCCDKAISLSVPVPAALSSPLSNCLAACPLPAPSSEFWQLSWPLPAVVDPSTFPLALHPYTLAALGDVVTLEDINFDLSSIKDDVTKVIIYTDGSGGQLSTPSWAFCILLECWFEEEQDHVWVLAGYYSGLVVSADPEADVSSLPYGWCGSTGLSPFHAEASALVWAIAWLSVCPFDVPFELRPDNLASLNIASKAWSTSGLGHLGVVLREFYRVLSFRHSAAMTHVAGHTGDPWNELADRIAAATSLGLCGSLDLPWLAPCCRSLVPHWTFVRYAGSIGLSHSLRSLRGPCFLAHT